MGEHLRRKPAVAGMFYPQAATAIKAEARTLNEAAAKYLQVRPDLPADDPQVSGQVKAVVVPHAGWVFSGMLAAAAWRRAALGRKVTKRIVLLGPTHRVAIRGVALPGCDQFGTPAGMLAVPTQKVLAQTQDLPLKVTIDPLTHRDEHALEVQVPLIIENFGEDVELIPLNVGEAAPKAVAEIIAALTDEETLIAVSSDLSHYHPYNQAERIDEATIAQIQNLELPLTSEQACGVRPLNGLLELCRQRGVSPRLIGNYNSGDTPYAGSDRVVGYAAFEVRSGS